MTNVQTKPVVDVGDAVFVSPLLWVLSADGARLWWVDTTVPKPTAQPQAGWPVAQPPR